MAVAVSALGYGAGSVLLKRRHSSELFMNNVLVDRDNKGKKVRYKLVFSTKAFKASLVEQKINEHEFFSVRQRNDLKRKREAVGDNYKYFAAYIEPIGYIFTGLGFLLILTGVSVEMARTTPFGDARKYMSTCLYYGVACSLSGVLVLSVCHLLQNKKETEKVRTDQYPYVSISERSQGPKHHHRFKTMAEQKSAFWSQIFGISLTVFLISWPLFFLGYIAEWSNQFPGDISKMAVKVAGYAGIVGLIVSFLVMVYTDAIGYWYDWHVLVREKLIIALAKLLMMRSTFYHELTEDQTIGVEPHFEKISRLDLHNDIQSVHSDESSSYTENESAAPINGRPSVYSGIVDAQDNVDSISNSLLQEMQEDLNMKYDLNVDPSTSIAHLRGMSSAKILHAPASRSHLAS